MSSNFLITEQGRKDVEGERFEWTADRKPPGLRGGARAMPVRDYSIGGAMRYTRTDYNGARLPSFQVNGHAYQQQSVAGEFLDRWNYSGWAASEMRRLEGMIKRGNKVHIQIQSQLFLALIVDYSFRYEDKSRIGYQLTFEILGRPGVDDSRKSPETLLTVSSLIDELELVTAAIPEDLNKINPVKIDAQLSESVTDAVADVEDSQASITSTFDAREQGLASITPGFRPFGRIAARMRSVGAAAQRTVNAVVSVRSDVDLVYRTAVDVLDFENWSRSLRWHSRLALGLSQKHAESLEERDAPGVKRLHVATEGESLYSISRKYYGTPSGWRSIMRRNSMKNATLDGGEILIIPERGER